MYETSNTEAKFLMAPNLKQEYYTEHSDFSD